MQVPSAGFCGAISRKRRAPLSGRSLSRGQVRILVVVASLVVLLALGASEVLAAITWTGTWSRDEHAGETMTLTQTGNSVTGPYTWSGKGNITDGVVSADGKELTGKFADKNCSGTFKISLEQNPQSYAGTFDCTGGSFSGEGGFNGGCMSGDCLKNTFAKEPPAPTRTEWQWAAKARRAANSRTTRIGSGGYRLIGVRFGSRGTFETASTPSRVKGRATATFVYRKVAGSGQRTVRGKIRFKRLLGQSSSGDAFAASSEGGRLRVAARITASSFPKCKRGKARLTFVDRGTSGSDATALKFLGNCRLPGIGRLRSVPFRNAKKQQSAQVVISKRS